MLVSAIARLNAINTMNNAAFQSLQISNNMVNMVNNAHTFGGEHDLSMLHEMDKKYSLDLATNSLLYKIAYLQEKMLKKLQQNELAKSSIDYRA